MGIKDKLAKSYANAYLQRYGDRMTQLQGNVLSIKVFEKTVLWIFHKLQVDILIKPERTRAVVKCRFKRNRWFKKPEFMQINQGNLLIIQGLKGKKSKKKNSQPSDVIEILNIKNLTTKKDLIKTDQKVQRVQQRQYIR